MIRLKAQIRDLLMKHLPLPGLPCSRFLFSFLVRFLFAFFSFSFSSSSSSFFFFVLLCIKPNRKKLSPQGKIQYFDFYFNVHKHSIFIG